MEQITPKKTFSTNNAYFKQMTPEERKEFARKNGIKAGAITAERWRRRKALSNIANDLLFSPLETIPDQMRGNADLMADYGFNVECAADLIIFSCIRKALDGDLAAIKLLAEITGQFKANYSQTHISQTQINIETNPNNDFSCSYSDLQEIQNKKAELLQKLKDIPLETIVVPEEKKEKQAKKTKKITVKAPKKPGKTPEKGKNLTKKKAKTTDTLEK